MKFGIISKKMLTTVLAAPVLCVAAIWFYYSGNWQLGAYDKPVVTIKEKVITEEYVKPRPLYVRYSSSAARVEMLYQPLNEYIKIQPQIRGEWSWLNDSTLRFVPENDFLPDTNYNVVAAPEIFNPQVKIKEKDFSFTSPQFKGKVESSAFYEDPLNVHNKSAIASFSFNYPLKPESIKNGVNVRTTGGAKYDFSFKTDDTNTQLHIISAPLKIAEEADFAKITVDEIENIYNAKKLIAPIVAKVEIPSSDAFFQVQSIKADIIRNSLKNNNPEQVLFVEFTTAVNAADLAEKFALYYSPEDCEKTFTKAAKAEYKLTDLKNIQSLKIEEISRGDEGLKQHIFKYDVSQPSGCLIAQVQKGLKSTEGYILAHDAIETTDFKPYPREVSVAADGAVLPLKGNHQVSFLTRGIDNLKVEVAQISAENLNHLATQTGGDFAHPFFMNYNFTENNIARIYEKNLPINQQKSGVASYASVNLDEYFQNKKGIFILRAVGFSGGDYSSNIEKRLIVITDLGIVVKDNADESHNIFVSDVSLGKPVADAKVEVLGKNGLPVLSANTNAEGMAYLPNFSNFQNDREPVVYKVSKNDDVSFLPINRYDRFLNMSRFDVGGEYDLRQGDYALKSSIFSDRGIYRPGETAEFGIIVRQSDLKIPQNLPFLLEIRNPNGDLAANAELHADNVGFMTYRLKLAQTAVTGQYNLTLYVKGKDNQQYYVGNLLFKVEEFLPDNLKIKVKWEDVPVKGWTTKKDLRALIDLQNLYGTPAVGHTIKASYIITPTIFRFKEYANYVFLTPNATVKRRTYEQNLPDVKTDLAGMGTLNIDLSAFKDGPYGLRLYVEGLEQGSGRGVKASLGLLTAEEEYLVGWKADGDLNYIHKNATRHISFVAINNTLKQIVKDNLVLKLVRKDYVASLVAQPNGTYRYQMVPKEVEVYKKSWQIDATGTKIDLQTDTAGEYVLRIETNDGRILANVEYTVVGASNMQHTADRESVLGLKLNRNEYKAGEDIEMQITAPYIGYGLITIEQDKVYAYKWFKADTQTLVEHITLPDNAEGNAYVNVAFFRDVKSPEIYLPALSYAAVPFNINQDNRLLKIELDVPQKVKSGEKLVVNYKTTQKAKIIIFGVNQGILQVAHYVQPNPKADFLKKKALRVITSQIMDLIMPDIQILQSLSASGGDDSYEALALEKYLNPFARKNAKPVAFWSGIIKSDDKGGSYIYQVPESFNGEIKVMAVAVSEERFGSVGKSVLVHSDFALVPSGPLNVSPGDEFIIGLSVENMLENSGNDYPVSVDIDVGDGFEVIGEKTQILKLSGGKENMIEFRLKALPQLGAKEIRFTAQSVADKDKKSVMPYTLSVRPATLYGGHYQMGRVRSKYKLKGVENLYSEYLIQQISASTSPLVLATAPLKYLDKFPHYCTEQTISKVFPAIEVFFKYPELLKNIDVYALFDDAIAKLYERQTLNGGFSAWSVSGAEPDAYASIYATHFLLKAQQHNFNVPQNMLERALAYCAAEAAREPYNKADFLPAYATYVLTLSGRITTNYLLNLEEFYKEKYPDDWHNTLGASFMAASYKLLQDNAKAYRLAGHYKTVGMAAEDVLNDYLTATYFADLFETLRAEKIQNLLSTMSDGNFTTKSAAWAVLTLNAIGDNIADKNIRFSEYKPQYTPFPTVDFTPETKNLTVSSDEPFYYAVSQLGFLQEKNIAATADGLEISKEYFDKNGNRVTTARIGDELTVKIHYRSLKNNYISDVAIVDLLSGCFEAVNNSISTDGWIASSEIREDRVVVYASAESQAKTISYKVRVVAQGKFIVPAVYGSALYQPLVRANSESFVITIDE